MRIGKEESKIIKNAVIEYEERHYNTENQIWQKRINNLIEKLKQEVSK
tara:strand:+ start:50 stop:193 length:144 start_codon:yes stop_codon:yes gene_type:complete